MYWPSWHCPQKIMNPFVRAAAAAASASLRLPDPRLSAYSYEAALARILRRREGER